MKCNSCGIEIPEGKRCPNCREKFTELTDLYSDIEMEYGRKIEYANFLKEILNICIRYNAVGVDIKKLLLLLDFFTKLLENVATQYSKAIRDDLRQRRL